MASSPIRCSTEGAVTDRPSYSCAMTVLTPDFYEYEWTSLESVSVDDHFVCLRWPDGLELRAYDLWLRENMVGHGGVDPSIREGTLDPAHFAAGTRAASAVLSEAGALAVRFEPEGLDATYHPGWLRHVAERRFMPASWLPEQVVWTTAELSEPPTHHCPDGHVDDAILDAWVDDLLRYGISRLSNVGTDPDLGLELGTRLGAVRHTNFGAVWDVKADIPLDGATATNSTANTSYRLAPHTDLPTRETPPGFQFLHCIENSAEGGYSTMADGQAVVAHLKSEHPAEYEALTTLRWVFFNRGHGLDHRWSGPVIDLGVEGSPLTLRAFYPLKAFPDMDEADVPRAYEATALFSRVAAAERFQMRYPFRPGDVVGFDNRRVLHGRDAYESGGRRHLRGFYVDQDELRSHSRVANRRRASRSTEGDQ